VTAHPSLPLYLVKEEQDTMKLCPYGSPERMDSSYYIITIMGT